MELPEFIDTDILSNFGYWLLTIGTFIAFLIGFKLADTGLLGVSDTGFTIPLLTKIFLLALTPVVSYLVSLKFFS